MAPPWRRWFEPRSHRGAAQGEQPPRARRIAVGDVHGCRDTLEALLTEGVGIEEGETVYLLGDLISKGPDSAGVLRLVGSLRERGVTVIIIRGNHEEELLTALQDSPKALMRYLNRTGTRGLLRAPDERELDPHLQACIADSHYYVALPDALLVHGGFNFGAADPFDDPATMVSIRSFEWSRERSGGRPVVHGHVATKLSTILSRVAAFDPIIPLDNGVVRAEEQSGLGEYGNLCALDLDTYDLYIQPNLDIGSMTVRYGLVASPHGDRPAQL